VLVVDPDPELAALIRQSLEKDYACRVGLAATSSEALAAARAEVSTGHRRPRPAGPAERLI
jgi:CheY-like chemotaxis protein